MNVVPSRLFRGFAGAWVAVLLAGAGCTRQEQERVKTAAKNTYEDSKAAMSRVWSDVKDYTYEKREAFDAKLKSLSSEMEVRMRELRTEYAEEKASASRKAAMEELKNAEANYQEKLRALGTASADTWEAAKQNVILAWERLVAAYNRARAD